jgi:transcriptional regulator with XRE-family HTH domain
MTNGARLREWRESMGLSQEEAARRIGAKQRTWAGWETFGTTPEVDYCEAIEALTKGIITMRDWARSRRRTRRSHLKTS